MNKTSRLNQRNLQALNRLTLETPSGRYYRLISLSDGVAHFREQDPILLNNILKDNQDSDEFVREGVEYLANVQFGRNFKKILESIIY